MPWPFRQSPEKQYEKGLTAISVGLIAASIQLVKGLMEGWARTEDAPDLDSSRGTWVNWRILSYLLWRCEEVIHDDFQLPQRHADKLIQDISDRTIERFVRHAYSSVDHPSEEERRNANAALLKEFRKLYTENAAYFRQPAEPYPTEELSIRPRPGSPTPDTPSYRLLRCIEQEVGIPLADRVWAHTSRVVSQSLRDVIEEGREKGPTVEDACMIMMSQVDEVHIRKIVNDARVIQALASI